MKEKNIILWNANKHIKQHLRIPTNHQLPALFDLGGRNDSCCSSPVKYIQLVIF